ncbi:MAG: XrtA/PEP-CTERM system exopolysaccharide export protein [Steroidobacteraceae bacterium]
MSRHDFSSLRRTWLAALAALGVALVLGASAAAAAQPAHGRPAQSAVASDYVIGPGDVLEVFVWRNPKLTITIPVRPDGKITTPLVQDMVAVGKTPKQLAHDVEKVLSKYLRDPMVDVIVTKPVSAYSQVKVIGQVLKPVAEPYRAGMTVLDAVLAAGGLTTFAAGNRAHLVRKEGGHEVSIRVKLGRLMNDGDMSQNLPLKPGDVIVVPESRF